MIRINLLPVEKRHPEKTPLPRFLLVIAGAALTAVLLFFVIAALLKIFDINAQIGDLNKQVSSLAKDEETFDKLSTEKSQHQAAINDIRQAIDRPFDMWHVIDILWSILHAHPRIWLEEIRWLDAKAAESALKRMDPEAKAFPNYGVQLKCRAAGLDSHVITAFRMGLKEHPALSQKLPRINDNPEWKIDPEKDYDDEYSMAFEVTLWGPTPAAPAGGPTTP